MASHQHQPHRSVPVCSFLAKENSWKTRASHDVGTLSASASGALGGAGSSSCNSWSLLSMGLHRVSGGAGGGGGGRIGTASHALKT